MVKFLKNTLSLCPVCLQVIPAEILELQGQIHIKKNCAHHGDFQTLHPWSNPSHYQAALKMCRTEAQKTTPDGLVININSSCNQHCPFCFARANEYALSEPTISQIKHQLSKFKGKVVYLSGGEPTLRKDIFEIIKEVKLLGFKVFLFSNGKMLADEKFVQMLKISGIDFVILQFDTFDDNQMRLLRGEELSATKINAIKNLKKYAIPVYLFVMLVKNINTDQIKKILEFTIQNRDCLKIVNFNPVWNMGRHPRYEPLDASEILTEVVKSSGLAYEDFFDISLMSYYLSEITGKLINNPIAKYPKCELRCYITAGKNNKPTPLTQLIDIKKINGYLKKIDSYLVCRYYRKVFQQIIYLFGFLLKGFLLKSKFRAVALNWLALFLRLKPAISDTKIISVIVGTFHTAFNIDLDFAKTCNLYSDYPDKNRDFSSSCLRQITVMKEFENGISR